MRKYRVVSEPDTQRPWIVQGDDRRAETWVDVARFNDAADARRYVQQVSARQQKDAARRRQRFDQ